MDVRIIEPPTVKKMWKIGLDDSPGITDGTATIYPNYVEVEEAVVSGMVGSETLSFLFFFDELSYPVRRSSPAIAGTPMYGVPRELILTLRRTIGKGSIFTRPEYNPWTKSL